MIWQTPWGSGFPGWHIECSAMSLHYLEGHVDLHIGGIDLRFPHHENERAQSNPLVGGEAVDLWLHGEHLLFEGRKMSKSAGNVVLLRDVIAKGIDPLAVRFCFLENRYRSQMDLSWQSMSAAFSTLQRWREKYQGWSDVGAQSTEQSRQVISEIFHDFCDDLDTPRAMIKLRSIEKDVSLSDGEKAEIFNSVDSLFGLNLIKSNPVQQLTEDAARLLSQRELARSQRDFATSDELRDKLLELGIEVRDSAGGQNWSWKVKL
jgi:cysteinyl-tRNA synthetase